MLMQASKKMLFFDIDGTLITDDERKYFPESAKQAISKARQKGHLAFINTGRVYVNIEEFIRCAGFDGYVCGCGTNIIAHDNELLHNMLSRDKCREVALKCREYEMMAIFEYRDHTGYDAKLLGGLNKGLIEYFQSIGSPLIDDIFDEHFIFDKFAFWHEEGNDRITEFLDYLSSDFTCIDRGNHFYEIVPAGFSKATGIEFLSRYFGIPLEDIYVFGDSNNDIDMLKYVPNSIVMGICSDEAEKIAAYKTTKVSDDGIYNAMKHFGVI